MPTQIVILAAGKGKRMHSALPKILHTIAGKPLLEHVIRTALTIDPETAPIIIYGHQGDIVKQALSHYHTVWVEQKEQLGTGHALLQALPAIKNAERVLVLYGDVPLISITTIKKLLAATPANAVGMLTTQLANSTGYGRIIRDSQNHITSIVEEKDATDEQRLIKEINPGIYLVPTECLKKWLPELKNKNKQNEYYLTDIVGLAVRDQIHICSVEPERQEEIFGVNDKFQLAQSERFFQKLYAEKLLLQGVTLMDPMRFDIRGEAQIGRDVIIDVNVILEGKVILGDGCYIGPNTLLRNSELGTAVIVQANSVIDGAEIAAHCSIGPFARIRPGTVLAEHVHVGNFVEVKNSQLGVGSKANHLTYLGDSEIGAKVNIGAGTITCNYDGVNKHKTIIHEQAFIGSNSSLVAPVTIGARATIGAGSVITEHAPAEKLTLTRSRQTTLENWQRPQKKEKI